MLDVTVINLPHIGNTPVLPSDLISRDALLHQIEKTLEHNDIVYIQGEQGIGKTTLLMDFVYHHSNSSISHFIDVNYNLTYSFDFIIENIYKQIYFLCNNIECDEDTTFDLVLLSAIQSQLYRKIRKLNYNNENLYFVFDGFDNLTLSTLENISSIFDSLPWGRAKFIFSGSEEKINNLFLTKSLKTKINYLINFSISETKLYFQNFNFTEEQIIEIHKVSDKGLPATLKEIKLLCNDVDDISTLFDISEDKVSKTNIYLRHWEKTDPNDEIQKLILAFLAFSDIKVTKEIILNVFNDKNLNIEDKLLSLPFIVINNGEINYHTESLKNFAKNKLKNLELEVSSLLIQYYEDNIDNEESKFNLPNLYRKSQKWEQLTKFYETNTFIHLLEQHQSMGNLNIQFTTVYEDSKKGIQKFNEARLRFALHKSSVKDLEKHPLWESEVEARMELGDYEQALLLANTAFLKEDRLKLLATLAKYRKIKHLTDDLDLNSQIKDLYNQIDFSKIREKGFEIAGLLLYCDLELAINLVEKVSDNSASKNSLDYAFAYLTLFATEANRKTKSQIADIDLINSRIQNSEVKNVAHALRFLSDEFSFKDLLESVENLTNFNQKLFLLKNWISNNKENESVFAAIKYTLEEIVKASIENVPDATSLAEISSPLIYIENNENVHSLIELFDTQRNVIDRPTKDFVKLQLNIAEVLLKKDFIRGKDRIFDIYLFISDLNDLSIKTDCLCLLWIWLSKNDPDKRLENLLSATETIEFQTRNNLKLLLKDTAYHFKMIEFAIGVLVAKYPLFIIEIIKDVNTEERRDYSYKIATEYYLKNTNIDDLDFDILNTFYKNTSNILFKEDIIIEVVDKFFFEKEKVTPFITKLLPYYDLISSITKIGNKCYIITHAIKILNHDKLKFSSKIESLLKDLYKNWEKIDIQWEKIEIAYLISKDLAEFSNEESRLYLNRATELKNNEIFSSSSSVEPYINSIRLTIRAFCGLLQIRDSYDLELENLKELINKLDSIGERLKLYSELSLRILSYKKKDLFDKIYRDCISPLLDDWGKNLNDSYKSSTIGIISPAIYSYNRQLFETDYLPNLSELESDYSIKNICNYILTGQLYNDPIDDKQNFIGLSYPEINELCGLAEKLNNDFSLNMSISFITKAIKNNKNNLSKEQLGLAKDKLLKIINSKFPSKRGIQHDGYKIIAEAEVKTIDKTNDWNALALKARRIVNLSDRALVLVMLSDKIDVKNKKQKFSLLEEAFEYIKTIPSVYDKSNRFDVTWETLLDIDRGKFLQYMKIAYQDLLSSKDGEINGLRNLIDVAQQHDPNLAKEFVKMLDQDNARKKLKEPFLNRIENKNKIKNACEQLTTVNDLNTNQFREVSRKYLEGLNGNTRTSKDIKETIDLLDKSSKLPLSESFDTYMYFIHNANKRFEVNKQNPEILSAIYTATFENSKLIGVLSSDNISKMKNLYNTNKINTPINNHIFEIGSQEKDRAISFVKEWLTSYSEDKIYLIDTYFSEKDLIFLKWIKEINPNCEVFIITGKKKSERNDHKNIDDPSISTNKFEYINSWRKISEESPISTAVRIVWDKDTYDCPFHDRWLVLGDGEHALGIGTSLNGFGNRIFQINIMQDLSEIKNIIDRYIFRKEKKAGKLNLTYEDFDIEV